uniref:Uncharacterized protein n=1 Tax=Kalanchoe fedtschenkoi TaxID=63787 RepID=A0A7N0V6Q1_KALFE
MQVTFVFSTLSYERSLVQNLNCHISSASNFDRNVIFQDTWWVRVEALFLVIGSEGVPTLSKITTF